MIPVSCAGCEAALSCLEGLVLLALQSAGSVEQEEGRTAPFSSNVICFSAFPSVVFCMNTKSSQIFFFTSSSYFQWVQSLQLVIWRQCNFFINWSVGKHLWIQFLHRIFFSLFFLANTFMWIGKGVLEVFGCSFEHTESVQLRCLEFIEACSSRLELKNSWKPLWSSLE